MTTPTPTDGPLEISAPQPEWAVALEPFASMRGGATSSLPILGCFLLQFLPDDECPGLTRTDRERQLRLRLPLGRFTCRGRGELAIDAGKLTSLIKALPQGADIALKEGRGRVSLTATQGGRRVSQFQLGYLPGSDFPLMSAPSAMPLTAGGADAAAGAEGGAAQAPQPGEAPVTHAVLAIPGDRLAKCIAQVAFAMAKADVRYYLNGLLLEWRASSLLLVATDGYRLANIGTMVGVQGGDGQVIVPADTVAALAKLGQEVGEEELRIEIAPSMLHVETEDRELISKLIDGKYPDWRRVVPPVKPMTVNWVLSCDQLAKALARVRILAHEQFHGARFECTADEPDLLKIKAVNTQQDEAEEVLVLGQPARYPVSIGFNLDLLLGAVTACPTETINLQVTDGSTAGKLVPGTSVADTFVEDPEWVVMPMLL